MYIIIRLIIGFIFFVCSIAVIKTSKTARKHILYAVFPVFLLFCAVFLLFCAVFLLFCAVFLLFSRFSAAFRFLPLGHSASVSKGIWNASACRSGSFLRFLSKNC